jgi:hypothetical protein
MALEYPVTRGEKTWARVDQRGWLKMVAASGKGIRSIRRSLTLDAAMQVGLVAFTGLGFLLTAFKFPQYGLIANLIAQVFWLYSSYWAWRKAGQIGIFIAAVGITLIVGAGVINYWVLAPR